MKRVFGLFRPYRAEVIAMLFVVLIAVVLGTVSPFILRIVIDEGISKKNLGVIAEYSSLTIVLTLLAAGATLLYGYQSVVIGQKIMCKLRLDLFTHLQGMSLRFFTSTRTGDIQTRLISDVGGVQNVVCNTFVDVVSNVALVIGGIVGMFIMDWRLTLLALGLIPLFAFIGKWIGDFARNVRKGTQEQTSELNSMMEENLSVSGALLGKTIGRADVLTAKFDRENNELAAWQIKSSVLQYVFFGMIRMITQIVPALIYWLAGWLLFKGDTTITVGLLVSFSAMQMRFFFPLTGIMGSQVELISSMALFDRIFEYIDMPHDIQDHPGSRVLPRNQVKGDVKFEDVGFKYDQDAEEWTLRQINLEAKAGQLIALVGPSGAGKTTVTYLIPRLYDVDAGKVSIDGIDIRDLSMESLKQAVGMVTQETYLVHTTVAENLRIAKPDATDEELVEACKAAAIHDHIAGLENGYNTVVGERGYKLSGGEKQRIAIARAILKDAPVLLLDEATSALDAENEVLVQAALENIMKDRTTLVIAHRLATVLKADRILVMDEGAIVEEGTHAELVARGGLYARLARLQFETGLVQEEAAE